MYYAKPPMVFSANDIPFQSAVSKPTHSACKASLSVITITLDPTRHSACNNPPPPATLAAAKHRSVVISITQRWPHLLLQITHVQCSPIRAHLFYDIHLASKSHTAMALPNGSLHSTGHQPFPHKQGKVISVLYLSLCVCIRDSHILHTHMHHQHPP